MSDAEPIVITKRDGTLERFSLAKLSNCLATAIQGRAYDPRLAGPLSRAVAQHLSEWHQSQPPTTEYIYRCLQSVLQQTGLSDVAEDLEVHRRLRCRCRRRIRILDGGADGAAAESWRKTTLVGTLQNRYGLRYNVARFLAGRIEAQLLGLGYRVISRSFLDELARSEVLAWGLADTQVLQSGAAGCEQPVAGRPPQKEDR